MLNYPFIKMNGLGNDFVIFDRWAQAPRLTRAQVHAIADRDKGVGCDQVIILEKPQIGDADVFMRIYNADGGEVDACGNATRCVARRLMETQELSEVRIQTNAGVLRGRAGRRAAAICVDMGRPKWQGQDIPVAISLEQTHMVDLARCMPELSFWRETDLRYGALVNMGNPHLILFPEQNGRERLKCLGSLLEGHPFFPEGVNVSMLEIINRNQLHLNVWERGAGMTQACGTAACASVVAARRRGLCDASVDVCLPGGDLRLTWDKVDEATSVLMEGPVEEEFRGRLDLVQMVWRKE